ncbi:hypothetical protein [Haloarchaeobius sp. HRN-SO-5]|uniref:hypothetical protein n=1 Tax=Haloarchaeobius sp. HRN-SO-5 TaxID=3446118 RepID=UPI003EBA6F9D
MISGFGLVLAVQDGVEGERLDARDFDRCEHHPRGITLSIYVVSQHFGLDASNSAFYVAAWDEDPADAIRDRLQRVVSTAQELIDVVEVAQE